MVSSLRIEEILASSGKLVGLGDFRPARKGPYGRFSIVSWEEKNKTK